MVASKKESAEKITGKMGIIVIVQKYPQTVDVFFKHGMHCLGCAAAHFENLEQAAEVHGLDLKALLKDLNDAAKKPAKE